MGKYPPIALKMVVVSTMPMMTKTPMMAYPAAKSARGGLSQHHLHYDVPWRAGAVRLAAGIHPLHEPAGTRGDARDCPSLGTALLL